MKKRESKQSVTKETQLIVRESLNWTESNARLFLSRWSKSGMSLKSFCEKEGVNYGRVKYWKYRLSTEPESGMFVPVEVIEVSTEKESICHPILDIGIEVELRSGRVIRIDHGVNESVFRELVRVLEEQP